jgi:hypothetical protein
MAKSVYIESSVKAERAMKVTASNDQTRIIGYFAFFPPMDVVCDGPACVIAGSEEAMKRYIGTDRPLSTPTIRKTRFGEILEGMKRGGAYAFDEQSYNRFFPLAVKAGLGLKPETFSEEGPTGIHFVRVSVEPGT